MRRHLIIPAVCVALFAVTGCGTPTEDTAVGPAAPAGPTEPVGDGAGTPTTSTTLPGPIEGVDLAGIRMDDLTGGGEVQLADALDAPPGTPVLAFFWAPFCSSCRAEAPMLDQLAREAPAGLRVVGIGALDDLNEARAFRTDTAVRSFPLLWAESTDSWSAFGVPAQPYLVLIEDGKVTQRWPGGASPEDIAAAVSA